MVTTPTRNTTSMNELKIENQWIWCMKNPLSRYRSKRVSNGAAVSTHSSEYVNVRSTPAAMGSGFSDVRFTSMIWRPLYAIANRLCVYTKADSSLPSADSTTSPTIAHSGRSSKKKLLQYELSTAYLNLCAADASSVTEQIGLGFTGSLNFIPMPEFTSSYPRSASPRVSCR
eukprot:Amastigsp_a174436_467.p4 type:complete len:172 gc:universal Amastigsp_a174436_467:1070-1585(+)